jgi:two-component system sporulation sensor kinase B
MNVQIIKDLLINLLFVILPFYFYLLFGKNRKSFSMADGNVLIYTIEGSIMMIMCMYFPIKIMPNHMFDLREIPLIISFLYVGRTSGVILFIVFIVVRSFWGGEGFYGAIVVNSLLLILLFVIRNKFQELSVKNKFVVASGLTMFSCITIHVYFLLFLENDPTVVVITPQLFVAQTIGLFIIIFSIEKLKRDAFMERNLQNAEKAQIVSDLAAAVSHEIRNPLTVTKGFLQVVIRQPLPDRTKEQLRMAQEELSHAENIINDYLTFAKPSFEHQTVLNLVQEINKVVRFITPYANMQSVQINFRYDSELRITGDMQKIHQCLSNILKNSIEAMPNGGSIDIYLGQTVNDLILLEISDTGVGMSPEQLKRMGEPYYTTKQSGTGLGMMVVYSIIKSMNGKMNVSSEKGKGTKFQLKFQMEQLE